MRRVIYASIVYITCVYLRVYWCACVAVFLCVIPSYVCKRVCILVVFAARVAVPLRYLRFRVFITLLPFFISRLRKWQLSVTANGYIIFIKSFYALIFYNY